MVQNKGFIYKSVPEGWPVAGENIAVEIREFDLEAPPPRNGVTTKNLYAAFDPTQRSAMRAREEKSYHDAMLPGEPVISVSVIARVLKTDNPKFEIGTLIVAMMGTEEYSSVPEKVLETAEIIEDDMGLPLPSFLGSMGMTGLTAYGSLMEIAKPKEGDVMFLSGAAGAVGMMVGQFAVRLGVNVIASVGDDNKLDYVIKELGFTSGFNYKKEKASNALKRLAPDGIDIYYDNVGGEQLDAALEALKLHGRIVACGSISQYNSKPEDVYGIKNTALMVRKRLRWEGFLVWDDNIARYAAERDEKVSKWILDGSVKSVEHITVGIDQAVEGFLGMLKGENIGKAILKIADH